MEYSTAFPTLTSKGKKNPGIAFPLLVRVGYVMRSNGHPL
jgi:hypothetical protein